MNTLMSKGSVRVTCATGVNGVTGVAVFTFHAQQKRCNGVTV